MAASALAAALILGPSAAQAATICDSCDYLAPATYLGSLNPTTNDQSTFQHASVPTGTNIADVWVFDVAPSGAGSASANFTVAAPFTGFTGGIYAVTTNGTCGAPGSTCTGTVVGGLIAGDVDIAPRSVATALIALPAGRYAIQLFGTAGTPFGTYTGQVATNTVVVPEPAMLALLSFGLGAAGRAVRRRRAQK
jgi:hypothetical protein